MSPLDLHPENAAFAVAGLLNHIPGSVVQSNLVTLLYDAFHIMFLSSGQGCHALALSSEGSLG